MLAFFKSPLGTGLLVTLAVLFFLWRFYAFAAENARNAMEVAINDARDEWNERIDDLEDTLSGRQQTIFNRLNTGLDDINIEERTIVQPTIEREIRSEVRFTDPDAGITDGMLAALNRSRRAEPCNSAPDGSIVCALPGAEPDTRPDDRDAGEGGLDPSL